MRHRSRDRDGDSGTDIFIPVKNLLERLLLKALPRAFGVPPLLKLVNVMNGGTTVSVGLVSAKCSLPVAVAQDVPPPARG